MAQIKLNATYGMTGTLPAVSGANLTTLNGSNISSGTVADARISALTASKLTGALPAISGASLTNLSAGKVLQVINATNDDYQSTTSTSFGDTNMTGAITPSATSSKVAVWVNMQGIKTGGNTGIHFRLLRGSTVLQAFQALGGETEDSQRNDFGTSAYCHLDSPSTTSATTYKVQYRNHTSAGSVRVNSSGTTCCSMMLMEISA